MASPAERYAASRQRHVEERSELTRFRRAVGLDLDPFQVQACEALESGRGVLVAAPTGAGKTVVGEFAVHLALASGRKAFYTTPIKALSNQKHAELAARFGPDRVGLLTGDTSVNGNAPVVVMTTEVLRNMLYADSPALAGLAHVVMDEVHYLADRFRGAVWEEVIIHLPDEVLITSLSATVSNAEEFGAWLETVRGRTAVVVSEERPVPLWQHVLVGTRLLDLFTDTAGQPLETTRGTAPVLGAVPVTSVDDASRRRRGGREGARAARGRPGEPGAGGAGGTGGVPAPADRGPVSDLHVNPELVRLSREDDRRDKLAARGEPGRRSGRGGAARPATRARRSPTSRAQVLERLDDAGLLPAIVFVFSRAGCDAAVRQCVSWGLRLTTDAERREVRALVEERCAVLPDADLAVLGYWEWLEGLSRGVAAHHAGLLPTFKEVVEELFSRGLVKAVFATETLALGINMPARSVVLEKLVKFNGESHVDVTPGEYTQLTGRAGRRGIDVEGHAVVLWQGGLDAEAVAGLASTRTYPLRSSFRPTYNMAVNLVGQVGRARAREVLETSFAQFQADRGVVGLARQARSQEEALAGYAASMRCHLGDFAEYAALRRRVGELEKDGSREAARARRAGAVASLAALAVGDVIAVPAGRRPGYAVVLDPGLAAGLEGPRPTVLTAERQVRRLSVVDVPGPVRAVARVRVPASFDRRDPAARRDLASSLRTSLAEGRLDADAPRRAGRPEPTDARDEPRGAGAGGGDELTRLHRQLRQHPCHSCPEREDHARWATRWTALEKEHRGVLTRIEGRTGTIARTFDRVCDLLVDLGYLRATDAAAGAADVVGSAATPPPAGEELEVTVAGQLLRRVYAEKDLLVAQCLREGTWDGLDAAGLATVLSTIVYEARREEGPPAAATPGGPAVARALAGTVRAWSQLSDAEAAHHLPGTSEPDLGLVWPVHRWCRGQALEAVLDAGPADLAAGDLVRWCRQLLDLLDQVVVVAARAGAGDLAATAREAIALVDRGVVAYSAGAAAAAS